MKRIFKKRKIRGKIIVTGSPINLVEPRSEFYLIIVIISFFLNFHSNDQVQEGTTPKTMLSASKSG